MAYYCRTCDSHAQFDKFEIAGSETYEKHLNKYNVIHGNMTELISYGMDIMTGIAKFKRNLVMELIAAYPEITFGDDDVISAFKTVYNQTKTGFVFIFDEWNRVFREKRTTKKARKVLSDF